MGVGQPLRGQCSCGRNNYIITLPENAASVANVFFDCGSESRRTQAALLTAWLRVPLSWFQSQTISFYPDETHSMIRKMFTPSREPNSKRVFCGYCGTHLTCWCDTPEEEADFLNVTVGSLFSDDIRMLQQLGLLAHDAEAELPAASNIQTARETSPDQPAAMSASRSQRSVQMGVEGDFEWVEEMVNGSWLGRSRRTRRGVGHKADGTQRIEWEVSEINDSGSDPESGAGRGKRKLDDAAGLRENDMED